MNKAPISYEVVPHLRNSNMRPHLIVSGFDDSGSRHQQVETEISSFGIDGFEMRLQDHVEQKEGQRAIAKGQASMVKTPKLSVHIVKMNFEQGI